MPELVRAEELESVFVYSYDWASRDRCDAVVDADMPSERVSEDDMSIPSVVDTAVESPELLLLLSPGTDEGEPDVAGSDLNGAVAYGSGDGRLGLFDTKADDEPAGLRDALPAGVLLLLNVIEMDCPWR